MGTASVGMGTISVVMGTGSVVMGTASLVMGTGSVVMGAASVAIVGTGSVVMGTATEPREPPPVTWVGAATEVCNYSTKRDHAWIPVFERIDVDLSRAITMAVTTTVTMTWIAMTSHTAIVILITRIDSRRRGNGSDGDDADAGDASRRFDTRLVTTTILIINIFVIGRRTG